MVLWVISIKTQFKKDFLMKINLEFLLLICAVVLTVGSYMEYYFGINSDQQFQQGVFFVIGIIFLFISFYIWKFTNKRIAEIEVFKNNTYHIWSFV